ncbi:MAG: DNA-deoxyinosine glycosylase [Puniceicoccales bacterium]|jgi:hypoxanthine-DNA glycosylase|nr:DNA-deoxyinosine glycosylase [Puniceicoccales bacterium]
MRIDHPFSPIYDEHSKILILGSFPSPKSREDGFYYAHPRNRFWEILAWITKTTKIPNNINEKKLFLLKNKIALWDVIKSCDIEGSVDNTIKNAIPSDLSMILKSSNVRQIFLNGGKAHGLYKKHWPKYISLEAKKLPSSSPANASYNILKLIADWNIISPYLR